MATVRSSRRGTWTRAAGVSDALRREVTRRGAELLERTFKPLLAHETGMRTHIHLAYFRHTDRWQPVYLGLTADECFDTIEQEEIFWPLT